MSYHDLVRSIVEDYVRKECCGVLELRRVVQAIEDSESRQDTFLEVIPLEEADCIDQKIISSLEARFPDILREYQALMTSAVFGTHPRTRSRVEGGNWNVYYLYTNSGLNHRALESCPSTIGVLQSMGVKGEVGLAYFSRLEPQTQIKAHSGPHSFRMRYHLGLEIPDGDCGINIAGMKRTWFAGSAFGFNDGRVHSAWNNSVAARVVLILDVWHPSLSCHEKAALTCIANAMQQGRFRSEVVT